MSPRLSRIYILAMLAGIAILIFFSRPAMAQEKQPASPQLASAKGPTPTPGTPEKPLPPGLSQKPEIFSGVDYSASVLNARGAHSSETSHFNLTIVNRGAATGAATQAHINLPGNATFVPGSAHAQGGGTLTVSDGSIYWAGVVASMTSITVTYQVVLPLAVGQVVTTTATIFDPGLPALMTLKSTLTTQASAGGPDAFGYAYQDSLAQGGAVTFSWIPTDTLSTLVILGPVDDLVSAALPIGFSFRFYRNTYTDMYINSNGLVLFGPGNATNTDNNPKPIPDPILGLSHNFASCFWADLYMLDSSQGVWMETYGVAPNRYTVITFQAAYFADMYARPALFQMILFETSNRIKCQYAHTKESIYGSGGQAQIGLLNDDGTVGISYFFHNDYYHMAIGPLEDGLAILFTPGPAALPVLVSSSVEASANVHPGDVVTYTVHIRNTGTGPSSITHMTDPIPANAEYVSGSAAVLGGGALDANAQRVNWSGTINAGASVTVTFQAHLTSLLGSLIVNTVTISDPQAVAPVTIVNKDLRVLPPPTGGPDSFGYTFADSYAGGAVTYSWVPTTTPSSKVNFGVIPADDVFTGTIPIGFSFRFYAGTYTGFYVSSNGLVSFGAGYIANINTPIPTPPTQDDPAANFTTCFWSDLYILNASQGVWVETHGSAPNRYTVITFHTAYFNGIYARPTLFQMILYEGSNQIKCQYNDVGGTLLGSGGGGATVGLENADGTSGIQYFFLQTLTLPEVNGPLENHLAVLFTPGTQVPVFTASTKLVSPQMHPGETLTYTLGIRNDAGVPSTISTLSDPIPAGMTYVPGSATVVGGGLLNATSTNVGWQGTVAAAHGITVTFNAVLNAPFGPVTNTATIDDPSAVFPIDRSAMTPVQPATGFGVGLPGYLYQDSYSPGVSFSWVPTTTNSIKLTITVGITNDAYGSLPLGFAFPFFDHSYSTVQISTNGLVSFNGAGSTQPLNQPIPTPGAVDNFATCFWDDQAVKSSGQGIWLETFGSAPDRYAVITFELQDVNQTSGNPYLYQMILYENGGAIKCQYKRMDVFVNGDGRSATIGLEDRFGTSGVQYFYNRMQPPLIGPVEDGLAIVFKRFARLYLPALMK